MKPAGDDLVGKAAANCLALDTDSSSVTLFTPNPGNASSNGKAECFAFDCIGGPDAEQELVFESVAKPVTDYCLQGYNGTIFA